MDNTKTPSECSLMWTVRKTSINQFYLNVKYILIKIKINKSILISDKRLSINKERYYNN